MGRLRASNLGEQAEMFQGKKFSQNSLCGYQWANTQQRTKNYLELQVAACFFSARVSCCPSPLSLSIIILHTSVPEHTKGKSPFLICDSLNHPASVAEVRVSSGSEQIMTSRGCLQPSAAMRMNFCWNNGNLPFLKKAVRHSHIVGVNLTAPERAAHFRYWHNCTEKSTCDSRGNEKNTTGDF